jgi:hypothetical protein
MAGCRGDGVPYSQLTNGSNISVGGWGCRGVRLTTRDYDRSTVIFHCALGQRTCTSVYGKLIRRASGFTGLAVATRVPDRDMLQRSLVARPRDEVALQPPPYPAWFEQPPSYTECTRKFLRSACQVFWSSGSQLTPQGQ